jgi:hypothetical protein
MFDKINGPSNPMAGPAQGHSTEQGDSWHTAVAKINENFKRIVHAIETGPSIEGVEMVDAECRKEIAVLRGTVSMLQAQLDALNKPPAAPQAAPVADVKPPETPPPSAAPIADFSAAPVATGGPGVVTTATTYIGAGGPAS